MADTSPRAQLIGHEAVCRDFYTAFTSGHLHHAWLLGGMEGIGKATLAMRMAAFVLSAPADRGGEDLSYNSQGHASRLLQAGAHPDFIHIQPEESKKQISVEDVRKIEPIFRRTASEGGWRVALIDGVDLFTVPAQNALLKILEEPPAQALFLLTASAPGRLLPTIRSRVRQVQLEPLPDDQLMQLVNLHLPLLEESDKADLVRLSEGSFGLLQRLHQTGVAELYREFIALLSVPQVDIRPTLLFAARLGGKGEEESYAAFQFLLRRWLQGAVKAAAGQPQAVDLVASQLAAKAGLGGMLALWDKLQETFSAGDGLNLDRKQLILSAITLIHDRVHGKVAA